MATLMDGLREHIVFMLLGVLIVGFSFGRFVGQLDLRNHFGLRAWETDDKKEWILVGVRMRGLTSKEGGERHPIAVVRLNVRTKEVRGAPRGHRDIVDGQFNHPKVSSDDVVLGAPSYLPHSVGKVVMCDTLYVRS
jgi:hypothetical protein